MVKLAHSLLAAALVLAPLPLCAQQARVVTTCGNLAPFGPQVAGGNAFPTMDITGRLCLSGGGSGGGTITAGTTPTSGFTAGQLLMSDGTKTQAAGAGTATTLALGNGTGVNLTLGNGGFNSPAIKFTSGYGIYAVGNEVAYSNGTVSYLYGGYNGTTNWLSIGNHASYLYTDAAVPNVISQRNTTSTQAHRVYNTYTDTNNGEWGTFDWTTTPNVLTIGTQNNGTGTARNVQFIRGGTAFMDFNQTRVNQLSVLYTLNANAYASGAAIGVSCTAGTVSVTTMVVTNGIVTHC